MKISTMIALCALTCISAHEITELKVPLYADPRRATELSCHYQMHGQRLSSVKWYKDMHEICRYRPSQKLPVHLFNVTGITVQASDCQVGSCMVRILPQPNATTAEYTCEVSTEGPKSQIARQMKPMTVIALPMKDPVITGAPKLAKPGDKILLNCSSDFSMPVSDINWYIDDEIAKTEPSKGLEVSEPREDGLHASWRMLQVSVPLVASGALRVRCETSLPVEPPIVREAPPIIIVYGRPSLIKFVSSTGTAETKGVMTITVLFQYLVFILFK